MPVVKITVFVLILCFTGRYLMQIFGYKDSGGGGGWARFYASEEESIDVMIFGSSHAHCTVDNSILWNDFGIPSFTLSAGSQELDSTYYFMRESLKTQRPKVMLVEALSVTGDGPIANNETTINRNTMGMRWSGLLYEYVGMLSDSAGYTEDERRRAFLKFPVVHSRYRELTRDDFEDDIYYMKGYRGSNDHNPLEAVPEACFVTETADIEEGRREYLVKMMELCRAEGIQLIFFAAPYPLEPRNQMQFNAFELLAEEYQVPFINFNRIYQEIGFDYTQDIRDGSHVNNKGAAKVTTYLGQLMKETVELPDHRGEEAYHQWNLHSQYLEAKEITWQLQRQQDIDSYLEALCRIPDKYLVILSLDGNYTALGEIFTDRLAALGIDRASYDKGGVWVKKDGGFLYYSEGAWEYDKVLQVGQTKVRLLSKTGYDGDGEKIRLPEMVVNSTDYANVTNGFNIVVYDTELNHLLDAAGTDIYLSLDMVRDESVEYLKLYE